MLGGFYFMLLILVHTLVSLDFALSLVPGWKDSIFAPHHALTGFQAAAGTVLVTIFVMRTWGGFGRYIGLDPFWAFSKVLLGLTLLWGYFWFSEFMTFWYGRDPTEQSVIKLVMFESYRTAFLLNFFFSFLIPFLILIWNPVRKSVIGPTLAGASVLIGAFFMTIRLYVPAFGIEDVTGHTLKAVQPAILPDVLDIFIILGGLAGAALIYLLASRIFPILSIWEVKEGLLYQRVRPLLRSKFLVLGKPE